MVPRAVNALTDRVTKALRQVQKALKAAADEGEERETAQYTSHTKRRGRQEEL